MTSKFEIDGSISHIELATLNFDQWTLIVGVREYTDNEVSGMTHLLLTSVEGFRLLDEGDMLNYQFTGERSYVVEINEEGWLAQEESHGNIIVGKEYREFLIKTDNECVCVVAHDYPTIVSGEATA